MVKMKSAAMGYEDIIGLLHSCSATVGNMGHGRNQVNQMLNAFQVYLYKKLRKHLRTPLASTGISPHFSTISDKSTPSRCTNHAVMIVLMIEGDKTAFPIAAPPVNEFENSELVGGDANHLAAHLLELLA